MSRQLRSRKAIEAIGVLAKFEQPPVLSKLRILKLLYIAERELLHDTGKPILGSRVVAMDHGPLHSAVLDLINGQHIDEPEFSCCFDRGGYRLHLKRDPGVGSLSRQEIAKLNEVSERYANTGDWSLAHDVTHSFGEYKKHYEQNTSTTIPMESLIDAVGREDDKDEIIQYMRDAVIADKVFGN